MAPADPLVHLAAGVDHLVNSMSHTLLRKTMLKRLILCAQAVAGREEALEVAQRKPSAQGIGKPKPRT